MKPPIYSEHLHDIYEPEERRRERNEILGFMHHLVIMSYNVQEPTRQERQQFKSMVIKLGTNEYWRHEFEQIIIWGFFSATDDIVRFVVNYLRQKYKSEQPSVSLFTSLWSMGMVPLNVVKVMTDRPEDGRYIIRPEFTQILPLIKEDVRRQKQMAYKHSQMDLMSGCSGIWAERFTALSWLLAQC